MGATIKALLSCSSKEPPVNSFPLTESFPPLPKNQCRSSTSHPHPAAVLTRSAKRYRIRIRPPRTRITTPSPSHRTTALLASRVAELSTSPLRSLDGVAVTVDPAVATPTTVPITATTITVIAVPTALPQDTTVPAQMYAFLISLFYLSTALTEFELVCFLAKLSLPNGRDHFATE